MHKGIGAPLSREERSRIAIGLIDDWAAELLLRAAKGIISPLIPGLHIDGIIPSKRSHGLQIGEDLRIRTNDKHLYWSDIDHDIADRLAFWHKASLRFNASVVDKDFYKTDKLTELRSVLVKIIKLQGPRYDF